MIPGLAFTPDGQYDLSSPAKRFAAAEAMLRFIAIIPQAYHSRGAEWCRDEMRRLASEGAEQLARANDLCGLSGMMVDGCDGDGDAAEAADREDPNNDEGR